MTYNGWYRIEQNRPVKGSAQIKNKSQIAPPAEKEKPAPVGRTAPTTQVPEPKQAPPQPSAKEPATRDSTPNSITLPSINIPTTDPLQNRETETRHSETVGGDGPVLRHDTVLHETLGNFVNAKGLERAVHVKGFGAFGRFKVEHSMKEYTKAPFLQQAGREIPVLTRFSLAVSTKGTPDTGRNVRGFSTKFYTDSGVFDLLCNHIPVFLVRDAMRFPASINAFLPSPVNNLADPNRFWGFVANSPEATHFVTWLYSDVGTVKSLRHIRGYGVNTYVWRNAQGKQHYIKYHWLPMAGEEYIDRAEAGRLAGANPDIAGQDLFDAIAKGTPAEYELCVQIMDPADADGLPFDPLDDTKVWSEQQYPLTPVGRLILDRNPEDYNEQIEKAAFSPANLQEGIELSNDKMLQGRSVIYWDAQRRRLGPEFRKISVNKQAEWNPDMLVTSGLGNGENGTQQRSELSKPADFLQAGERYRALTDHAQGNLVDNIASELYLCTAQIQAAVLSYFTQADAEFGQKVAEKMNGYTSK